MTNSFKRLLRETSYKILGKVAACRSGSHTLVQHSSTNPDGSSSAKRNSRRASANLMGADQPISGGHKRASRHSKSKKKHHSSAIPEALLIASKNYLPPVQFHHVHGPNVQLQKNKFVARRTQSFCQALVFSNRVILPNERVYIKVLDIAKGWSGTIRFGFTSVDPATLRYQMPKHACPDMTNEGHTWARALADEVIKRNSVIHFSYNSNGYIHYGINNQDCGIFHANVNTNQNLWFIVDIYGLTAAVELIDPRIHNASGDLDLVSLDDEFSLRAGTMFKSTSAMDEILSQHFAMRTKQKKRSRKRLSAEPGFYHGRDRQHLPEGVILPPGSIGFAAAHGQGPLLPNLSSVMLPSAQQNIYSPMPNMISNRPEHDYYQIMTNNQAQPSRAPDQHNSSALSSAAQCPDSSAYRHPDQLQLQHRHPGFDSSAPIGSEAPSNNTGRRGARRSRSGSNEDQQQAEVCQQLSGLQIGHQSDNSASSPSAVNSKQQYSPSSSSTNKSLAGGNGGHHPVAAARRRLQSSIQPKDSEGSSASGAKAKSRQSVRSAPKANRDNNNNSPQSKDCPICFERPINCVLYQCGHMCTCYECGVKQWRTQQRTCPICRTIIKDVIKTYMS